MHKSMATGKAMMITPNETDITFIARLLDSWGVAVVSVTVTA